MLSDKSILVTGGTGSFGKKFISTLLEKYPEISRIVIYSRDELKQYEMLNSESFGPYQDKLRFFIGDVRDAGRLKRACEGIDVLVHAAAMKQVPASEYNPIECINTNIIGAENVINAAIECGIKKVVALSTDKAAAPINLYGATKLCSDKLFVAANNMKGKRDLKFMVVRYGNVLGSRGSVVPFFLKKKNTGVLEITHPEMTRFSITLQEGVDFVLKVLDVGWGGEIFIPRIPSYKILDVAQAIGPRCEHKIVGIRPGEKLHEEMITAMDALSTAIFKDHFVIFPTTPLWNEEEYIKTYNGKRASYGFKYSSDGNDSWLSVDDLRGLIKANVDPAFQP